MYFNWIHSEVFLSSVLLLTSDSFSKWKAEIHLTECSVLTAISKSHHIVQVYCITLKLSDEYLFSALTVWESGLTKQLWCSMVVASLTSAAYWMMIRAGFRFSEAVVMLKFTYVEIKLSHLILIYFCVYDGVCRLYRGQNEKGTSSHLPVLKQKGYWSPTTYPTSPQPTVWPVCLSYLCYLRKRLLLTKHVWTEAELLDVVKLGQFWFRLLKVIHHQSPHQITSESIMNDFPSLHQWLRLRRWRRLKEEAAEVREEPGWGAAVTAADTTGEESTYPTTLPPPQCSLTPNQVKKNNKNLYGPKQLFLMWSFCSHFD